MLKTSTHKLSSSWETRELLRSKGQFWTPDWIAEPMVEYVLAEKGGLVFDPAVGTGAFFRAAKVIASEKGLPVGFAGMEIDPVTLSQGQENGLTKDDIALVEIADFVLHPPCKKFHAIVANPPYIRHHRITPEKKIQLKHLSVQTIGKALDGRAGLHVYFLVRALSLLEENGRLAFIVPADVCEGKFASDLWTWITANFTLDAIVTFSPEASPFPKIDTNPLILLIRRSVPREKFLWAKCCLRATSSLKYWVRFQFENISKRDLIVIERDLKEGLSKGFSREPILHKEKSRYALGNFISVKRAIATGANDFFFMTTERARELKIPEKYFTKAIGRTRDVVGDEITHQTLEEIDKKGRPTLLLSLNGDNLENFPESVKRYLREGEKLGLPGRPLIAQRNPWYKMETRVPPPFLFAYLGRRNSRFIRNHACVVPLTSFLCVYPKRNGNIDQIWKILTHPDVLAGLSTIGKTYGYGAIKVEPRFLEKLPIPDHVVELSGLSMQMCLFE